MPHITISFSAEKEIFLIMSKLYIIRTLIRGNFILSNIYDGDRVIVVRILEIYSPVGQIAEKAVSRSVFLTTMALLYFECRINKNALIRTVFLAILPTKREFTVMIILIIV